MGEESRNHRLRYEQFTGNSTEIRKQTVTATVVITKIYKENVISMPNAHNEKQWWTDPMPSTLTPSWKKKSPFPPVPGFSDVPDVKWY